MACDNGSCRYLTQMAHSFRVGKWGSKWSVIEAAAGVDDADADAVVDAVVDAVTVTVTVTVTAVAVAVALEADYRK